MQVIRDALHADDIPRGVVATIGNYDGVHIGQRAVLDLVRERARDLGVLAAVVTFDPHPIHVLRPEIPVPRISTQAQKEALLDEAGIDLVAVIRFTPEFSQIPARSFVRDFLHERLGAREIYVGSRFAFGHRRGGDLSLLQQMGRSYGFDAFAIEEVYLEGEAVSSTRIRRALLDGDVALAARLLGRPYQMTGLVARGNQLGRGLGFPTINVAPDNELIPRDGVYATRVGLPGMATLRGVTNVGTRPTLYETWDRVVESHILDFEGDVYGERVELGFVERLRDERKFAGMMQLAEQIARDVAQARRTFEDLEARSRSER